MIKRYALLLTLSILPLFIGCSESNSAKRNQDAYSQEIANVPYLLERRIDNVGKEESIHSNIEITDRGSLIARETADGTEFVILNGYGETIDSMVHSFGDFRPKNFTYKEGKIYLIAARRTEESRADLRLYTFNLDGSSPEEQELPSIKLNYDFFVVRKIDVDSKGTLYVLVNHTIYGWKTDGTEVVMPDAHPVSFALTSNDNLIVSHFPGNGSGLLINWNPEEEKTNWKRDLVHSGREIHWKNHTLYVRDSESIFLFDHNGNFKGYLFDVRKTPFYFSDNDIRSFTVDDKDQITLIGGGENMDLYNYLLDPMPVREEDKVILTLSHKFFFEMNIRIMAARYMRENPHVKIVYEEEFSEHDVDSGGVDRYIQKLNTRLLAGEGPDILISGKCALFPEFDLDRDPYSQMGVLEDLTPYINGKDGINLDFYYPEIIQAYTRNGKIEALPHRYFIPGFSVNKDMVDAAHFKLPEGIWTWNEFLDLVEALQRDTDGDGTIDQFAMGYVAPSEFLAEYLLPEQQSNFFDDKKAVCDFSNPQFYQLLDLAERFDRLNNTGLSADGPMLSPYAIGIYPDFINDSILDLVIQRENMNANDVVFISQPGLERVEGEMFFAYPFSINRLSKNKEEAWKFIKFLLTRELQEVIPSGGIPVHKDAITPYIAKMKNTRDFVVSQKGERLSEKELEKYRQLKESNPDEMIWVFRGDFPSDKVIDEYVERLQNAERLYEPNRNVIDIVKETSALYFNGEITAEETAMRIQDRVSIILNE